MILKIELQKLNDMARRYIRGALHLRPGLDQFCIKNFLIIMLMVWQLVTIRSFFADLIK